jgi:hypothetical protein
MYRRSMQRTVMVHYQVQTAVVSFLFFYLPILLFYAVLFTFLLVLLFTPYYERDIGTMYILPQHDLIKLLCIKIFYVCPILSLSFILIVFSVVFRLAS